MTAAKKTAVPELPCLCGPHGKPGSLPCPVHSGETVATIRLTRGQAALVEQGLVILRKRVVAKLRHPHGDPQVQDIDLTLAQVRIEDGP